MQAILVSSSALSWPVPQLRLSSLMCHLWLSPRPSWEVPTTPRASLISPKVRLKPSHLYPEPLFLAKPNKIPSAPVPQLL